MNFETSNPEYYPRLLGDIGGTHARFAWQEEAEAPLSHAHVLTCQEFDTLLSAANHYLKRIGKSTRWAAFGIANPITGDAVQMTNHHWSFSIEALRVALGLEKLVVINDFTALALALPKLKPSDLLQLGGGTPVNNGTLAVIGPGTGLGVSGLIYGNDKTYAAIQGEGGHRTIAAQDPSEFAVLQALHNRFGHVSAERVLSGPGIVNLYQTLCELAGEKPQYDQAAQIVNQIADPDDPRCAQAISMFFGFLGSVAGDLALTLGARGGVYLAGGILPRVIEPLKQSNFRKKFEAKGRFTNYLKDIPCYLITNGTSPALLGASQFLDRAILSKQ